MTDKDTNPNEPSEAEKLRQTMEAHTKALQDNTEALRQQSASSTFGSSNALPVTSPGAPGDKGVKMIERNPELRLLLDGQEYGIRFCNTFDRKKIGDHMMRLRLPPITGDGPTGFQHTHPLNIILYLSPEEFYAKCTGEWVIDLREYCIPPDLQTYLAGERALGMPEMGDRMPDGTVYVGRSPEPGMGHLAMLAEPESETFRASFRGAKRFADTRSRETGQDYRVPSLNEWEQMAGYSKLAGGKAMGGFNQVSLGVDGWYWTSTLTTPGRGKIIVPKAYTNSSASKLRKFGVRLIRYVPVESLQPKPEPEEKPKPRLKLKLRHD